MKTSLRLVLSLAFVSVVGLALAQNVTGNWKGKISMDMSKLPAPKDDAGKKMMAQMKDMMAKMSISLVLNANKTYTVKASGIPGSSATQTSEGKWTQNGKTLTLTPTKENGKKPKDTKSQNITVSADGKTLKLDIPGVGGGGSIIFTR